MTRQRYKLTISYDGTQYSGWQIQPNAISIQSLIQDALKKICREDIYIVGSGRTDAGVHADHQVAHFSTETPIDIELLLRSLNGTLPRDIRIRKIEKVSHDFHARYSAKKKTYEYYLCLGATSNPISRLYSHHIRKTLDIEAMKKAAQYLIGEHNFLSFANSASQGSAAKNPVRNLEKLDISSTPDGIKFTLTSSGFLYKMVRNIVGGLLAVGESKITPEDLRDILEAKDRRKAPMAAPARGLFLKQVDYPTESISESS